MQNISQKISGAEHLTEVIAYLKNADKYIRQGDIRRALDEILHAREKNPTIMYARAYEEYVRSVLLKQEGENDAEVRSTDTLIGQVLPTLEKILDLAIKEVKRSAVSAYKQKEVIALQKRQEEEQRYEEQLRADGIAKKVASYLQRSRAFEAHNDFHHALNEIGRAFMLDPTDESILSVEEEIKKKQEAFVRKQEELDRQQHQEENKRREELSAQWQLQLKQETVEAEKKKAEAYKQARTQKIREYLQIVRGLFAENRIDEALSQLAFVMVVDPLNEEVLSLNWKIREAQSKKEEENIALKRQQAEEEKKKTEIIRLTARKSLEKAEEFLARGKFTEALRVITQAYYIDPANEDVLECEKRIMAAEEEMLRLAEEKRRHEEDERKRKQEAELHRLSIEQKKREQIRERIDVETRLLHDEEEILLYLSKARGFVSLGNYDEAVRQIALAFKINPFDEEIAKLQREIFDGQKKAKLSRKHSLLMITEPETAGDRELSEHIHQHIERAKKLRTEFRYQDALDEIAQAYRLDPMNEKLFALEGEIQQEFLRYQEQQQRTQALFKTDQGIKKSLAMARDAFSRDAYSEAQGWVDYALSFDMNHEEVLWLQGDIAAAQRLREAMKTHDEKELVIQSHLSKAEEFISAKLTFDAIFEVDLALRLDPSHYDALALRKRLLEISGKPDIL